MHSVECMHTTELARGSMLRERITAACRPVVLRQYLGDWPAVQQGHAPRQLLNFIQSFDCGFRAATYCAPAEAQGRFFYGEHLQGFNFERVDEPLTQALERIAALERQDQPPAVYVGAIDINKALPGFTARHRCDLAGHTATARLWVGNATTVSTHYDLADNLMCAVAGTRRITLFPPEQLQNLYVGPLDYTLSGQPVSMVNLANPDLARYPRFAQALEHAQVVELAPGDVLYIPKLWWHHVQSLAPINVMVNYWWDHSALGNDNGFTTLLHALTTIAHLPEPERRAWQAFFNHYIFKLDGDPVAHIEEKHRGVLGKMTPALYRKVVTYVRAMMAK